MKSTKIKSVTQGVLDQQKEIFKNLRNKKLNGALKPNDLNREEIFSEYTIGEDVTTPMGEVGPEEDYDLKN